MWSRDEMMCLGLGCDRETWPDLRDSRGTY